MQDVRLYQPSKTAMQSGKAKTHGWVLKSSHPESLFSDNVMGWTGTTDTAYEVDIRFDTLEEAMIYCKKKNLTPHIITEPFNAPPPKSYGDNFTKGYRY